TGGAGPGEGGRLEALARSAGKYPEGVSAAGEIPLAAMRTCAWQRAKPGAAALSQERWWAYCGIAARSARARSAAASEPTSPPAHPAQTAAARTARIRVGRLQGDTAAPPRQRKREHF